MMRNRIGVRAFLLATITLALSIPALAQSSAKPEPDKPLRFDVVSIRPSGESSKMAVGILPDGYEASTEPPA